MTPKAIVIGGGLAGCEAAWQIATRGVPVELYEMRPAKQTPAHKTGDLAELVCSNSLKSNDVSTSHGLLKAELRRLGSLLIEAADATRVPAGQALAVDRAQFSAYIAEKLEHHPNVTIIRKEVTHIPVDVPVLIATGPLTSDALFADISATLGEQDLFFYDAISPIVATESINFDKVFSQNRYDKGGDEAYLNCPMTEAEYNRFYEELIAGEPHLPADFERGHYFEGCMPIEEMARRGRETLTFGPMKPVGLTDPTTGDKPFAVVQLRAENTAKTSYNLVGFQTQLKIGEQKRIFRLIPGLENAEFYRYGSIHRNSYLNSPRTLRPTLQTQRRDDLFVGGQLTGVEGYVEDIATGLIAGINLARLVHQQPPIYPPPETATGALLHYITTADPDHFQPMNINFGLFPPITPKPKGGRQARRQKMVERALTTLEAWLQTGIMDENQRV
ncbi:MAG: methylenetetrahydrofolate--tRNA-(uracil(54)-C(5))-methyltransferase (FADH(2)-oxidizing) TrmFO [Gemmatimonadetes bacterium]|nr:MAG: methylenetetrahydrofolate--tRNA-(uracil(54)-C(5))-methyltransferase (FADH(2)-oxidizing) TrmFO [Gemmatimonadota bacterium]